MSSIITPSREILRPSNMSRRGFLRGVLGMTACASIPGSVLAATPELLVPPDPALAVEFIPRTDLICFKYQTLCDGIVTRCQNLTEFRDFLLEQMPNGEMYQFNLRHEFRPNP